MYELSDGSALRTLHLSFALFLSVLVSRCVMGTFYPLIMLGSSIFPRPPHWFHLSFESTPKSVITYLDTICHTDESPLILFRCIYCVTRCSALSKTLDVFSRKSAKKKIPTHIKKVLSEAEQNVIYREESEGTQGSSWVFWMGTWPVQRENHLGYVRSCV